MSTLNLGSIGLSGLNANQRALDSSAHNIANASTKGFQPLQADFQENKNGGVVVNISQAGQQANADSSGTDLSTEIVHSLQYKAGFQLSAKLIQTNDSLLGTLLDIKG